MPARDTWELTSEMFLGEEEIARIRESLEKRLASSQSKALWLAKTDQLIFEGLILSGLRNSEFCHLRLCDVPPAFKQPALRVAETPRQNRTVAIPQVLVALIVDYIEEVRPQLRDDSLGRQDRNEPLLLNERGRLFDRTALYRRVVKILTAAGFESRASVQLLRHTYGYLAYKRTHGNLLFVQKQLGHAHAMVTAVYAEFVKFSDVDLANLVAGPTSPFEMVIPEMASTIKKSQRVKGKQ